MGVLGPPPHPSKLFAPNLRILNQWVTLVWILWPIIFDQTGTSVEEYLCFKQMFLMYSLISDTSILLLHGTHCYTFYLIFVQCPIILKKYLVYGQTFIYLGLYTNTGEKTMSDMGRGVCYSRSRSHCLWAFKQILNKEEECLIVIFELSNVILPMAQTVK